MSQHIEQILLAEGIVNFKDIDKLSEYSKTQLLNKVFGDYFYGKIESKTNLAELNFPTLYDETFSKFISALEYFIRLTKQAEYASLYICNEKSGSLSFNAEIDFEAFSAISIWLTKFNTENKYGIRCAFTVESVFEFLPVKKLVYCITTKGYKYIDSSYSKPSKFYLFKYGITKNSY